MKKPNLSQRIELREEPINEIIVMKHKWRDLLFLHWVFDAAEIQKTLPEGLYADTFEGKAYVGIVPFYLYDVRPIFFPSVPLLSDFLEVNVRTYVYDKRGTPGIWFYSLDANQPVAVKLAQQINLPYINSEIDVEKNETTQEILFRIKRKTKKAEISSTFRYKKSGDEFFADSESLEFFLIERYLLFTYNKRKGNLSSVRVHHQPYPLFKVQIAVYDINLLKSAGLMKLNQSPDHIIMSTGVDVDIYNIRKT